MPETAELREVATGLSFPEGPVMLPDGDLLFTEMVTGMLKRVPAGGGEVTVVASMGGSANGAAIGPDGRVYVANSGGWSWTRLGEMYLPGNHAGTRADDYIGGRIQVVDLENGSVEDLYIECDGRPLRAPNDLVFDAEGGFWFTDHGHVHDGVRDVGAVYYALPDGSSIVEVIRAADAPNGIGLSPDGGRLYVAETQTSRVWWWDLAAPGRLANDAPFFGNGGTLLAGLPGHQLFDSLAIDGDGYVCVATIVNGGITAISPDGASVQHAALPDPIVTNICFGGDDFRTAYATLSGNGAIVAFEWPRPGLALAHQR
ncbi:MAG: SMP-30/gluconolactonase/LRE family protein [Acidimicrobiales bacterium]